MANWLTRTFGLGSTVEAVEQRSITRSPVTVRTGAGGLLGGTAFDILEAGVEGFRSNAVVARCLQIRTDLLCSLPLVITNPDGTPNTSLRAKAAEYRWNRDPGNGAADAETTRRMVVGRWQIRGQSHSYIGVDGSIHPLLGTVRRKMDPHADREIYPNGILSGWEHTDDTGRTRTYAAEEVMWLRYPDPNSTDMYSVLPPISAALIAIGLADEAAKWQAAEFANGSSAGVLFVSGVEDDAADGLEEDVAAITSGPANAGRVAIANASGDAKGGASWMPLSFSPREMSWLDGLTWTTEQILHAFSIPRDMFLGESKYENAAVATANLWRLNLIPSLRLLASAIDRVLVPEPSLTATFPTDSVAELQADQDKAVERKSKSKWLTMNEIREEEGKDPLPGGNVPVAVYEAQQIAAAAALNAPGFEGERVAVQVVQGRVVDAPVEPLALEVPSERAGESSTTDPEPPKDEYEVVLSGARVISDIDRHVAKGIKEVARLADRQEKAVIRLLNKKAKRGAEQAVRIAEEDPLAGVWFHDQANEDVAEFLYAFLGSPAGVAGAERLASALGIEDVWQVGNITAEHEEIVRRLCREAAVHINGTTSKALEDALVEAHKAGEGMPAIAKRVAAVFAPMKVEGWRANLIARDLSNASWHESAHMAAKASGVVVVREWMAAGDGRVRESHQRMDGKRVNGFAERYDNGALFPGDFSLPAKERMQCRCHEQFLTKREV